MDLLKETLKEIALSQDPNRLKTELAICEKCGKKICRVIGAQCEGCNNERNEKSLHE